MAVLSQPAAPMQFLLGFVDLGGDSALGMEAMGTQMIGNLLTRELTIGIDEPQSSPLADQTACLCKLLFRRAEPKFNIIDFPEI